jgi:hypothetical protein
MGHLFEKKVICLQTPMTGLERFDSLEIGLKSPPPDNTKFYIYLKKPLLLLFLDVGP